MKFCKVHLYYGAGALALLGSGTPIINRLVNDSWDISYLFNWTSNSSTQKEQKLLPPTSITHHHKEHHHNHHGNTHSHHNQRENHAQHMPNQQNVVADKQTIAQVNAASSVLSHMLQPVSWIVKKVNNSIPDDWKPCVCYEDK